MGVDRRSILGMGLASFLIGCGNHARAKAVTFGSVAEFRQYIMTILKDRHLAENVVPDPADPARFQLTAHGEPSTVDLTRIFAFVQANPDGNAPEVERFIRSITYDHHKPVDEKDILAVIRTQDYARALEPEFLREPLGADLVVVYVADEPDAIKTLSREDVRGKSLADVRKLALQNLREWLPKVRSDDELKSGVLYTAEGNELLATSLVLLDDFWKSVANRFPGDVLIALPRREQLFLFDDKPELHSGIRRLIEASAEDGSGLLSPQLYARRNGKIVAVPD